MTNKQYFKRALSLPPHFVVLKVYQLALFRLKSYWIQIKDTIWTTYSSNKTDNNFNQLFPKAPNPNSTRKLFPELEQLLIKTLNHEFDLLGSGWTQVFYNMKAKGILDVKYQHSLPCVPNGSEFSWINKLINRSNQKTVKKIWMHVSNDYDPIDWHIDFKSGYRWNSRTWWFGIPYGHKPGVDIKTPWEIARSHHMPWLALGYGMYKNENKNQKADQCAKEFQNQLLDFIASNPPRFGVNWRCPMDVAIRASNWILAYEWFRHYGWEPEENIKNFFANSLYDHGDFIFNNLEIGKDGFRGNHYLADICGLGYIASFLMNSKTINRWIVFSHKALLEEMDYQFFDDGANFEGSTAYHRLSAEMMMYTTLLFENLAPAKRNLLPSELFNSKFFQKLINMSEFSKCITKPDRNICQIGDNDNGRFFKIQPNFFKHTLEENHLFHQNLIECLNTFSKQETTLLDSTWISSFCNYKFNIKNPVLTNAFNKLQSILNNFPEEIFSYLVEIEKAQSYLPLYNEKYSQVIQHFPIDQPVNIELFVFEKFGICLWKGNEFFMSFRCGPIGQKGRGGHDHNDQLSIELFTKNLKIEDPGTGIYTPFPEIRNKYRSIASHFSPQVFRKNGELIEPGELDQGPFSLSSDQASVVLFASDTILAGYNKKLMTIRIIINQKTNILIQDICLNEQWNIQNKPKTKILYSRGYGVFSK